jgi:hypothetical protein
MAGEAGSLGARLRAVEQQHQKSCDVDAGAQSYHCSCRPLPSPWTRQRLQGVAERACDSQPGHS